MSTVSEVQGLVSSVAQVADVARALDPDLADALVIVGYRTEHTEDVLSRITRLGEVLLGARRPWRIRRLAAPGAERDLPTRRNVRREIDALASEQGAMRLVVITGEITRTFEGLGLVCAADLGGFREDATVPLAWIGERLFRRGPTIVLLVAHAEPREPARWLTTLAPPGDAHLVVASAEDPRDVIDALIAGLGSATGVVTPRALAALWPQAAVAPSASMVPVVSLAQVLPSDEDLIGTVLPGQLRIDAEIGRGGFSIVYRAHQQLVGRDVAVKLLRAGLTPESAQQFVDEIRAVARLDHRNVVRIFHADVTRAGRLFFAMEHLDGQTLEQLLAASGPFPDWQAIAIARQLLAGLGAAHARGLIHADVKPANVFIVGAEARVVLLDFGLARLRAEADVRSLGGTPAFMAPEQLRDGIVDVRSDLYAAGLVLRAMVTPTGREGATLEAIADPALRAALGRALDDDRERRFGSAAEMAAALPVGDPSIVAPAPLPAPPFRPAAPFSEAERASFFGRDREIETLLGHVLFQRAIIYVAPSGTGKTSLLRAGLLPRLADLGAHGIYVACRTTGPARLAEAIDPQAASVPEAITRHHRSSPRRLVVILDQIEAELHLAIDQPTVVELLALERWPEDAQVSVVLAVREEYLARLLDRTQRIEPGMPIVRLASLAPAQVRDVLQQTLAARDLQIEDALLDALVDDLTLAGAKRAVDRGGDRGGGSGAIYAPHLQLVGAVLVDALPPDATELTLALYRQRGGLAAIVAEHLHHVLEGELSHGATSIARDLLIAMVTAGPVRAARTEADLVAAARQPGRRPATDEPEDRSPAAIREVIGFLRDRGLLVASTDATGTPTWDLAHDSLVERIEKWITATDLARGRALELVRYHLRRSAAEDPSLLGSPELREVRAHVSAADLVDLDVEWARVDQRAPATALVAQSRQAIRNARWRVAAAAAVTLALVLWFTAQLLDQRAERQREAVLRDRDLGHFLLELRGFERDPATHALRPGPRSLRLDWRLHRPARDDEDSPGDLFPTGDLERGTFARGASFVLDDVHARGGPAVLVITRTDPTQPGGACRPIQIPIRRLPGRADFKTSHFVVSVPSCDVTRAETIEIPAGPFIAGGQGEPRTPYADTELPSETMVSVPAYRIDRSEVTNAAFESFVAMSSLHGIVASPRPNNSARYPTHSQIAASAVTWREARAFCRYLGKDLPTLDEWDKAMRGGIVVAGQPNPCPRRNFAWCGAMNAARANVRIGDVAAPRPVGSYPEDTSPYGLIDMVGGVSEWTRSPELLDEDFPATMPAAERRRQQTQLRPMMVTRGCNWGDIECATEPLSIMPLPNPRLRETRYFTLGFRCASDL